MYSLHVASFGATNQRIRVLLWFPSTLDMELARNFYAAASRPFPRRLKAAICAYSQPPWRSASFRTPLDAKPIASYDRASGASCRSSTAAVTACLTPLKLRRPPHLSPLPALGILHAPERIGERLIAIDYGCPRVRSRAPSMFPTGRLQCGFDGFLAVATVALWVWEH